MLKKESQQYFVICQQKSWGQSNWYEYSRKSKFNIQFDSVSKFVSFCKMLIIMHNLGSYCVACFYCKAEQQDSLDAFKQYRERRSKQECSLKGIFIISNI